MPRAPAPETDGKEAVSLIRASSSAAQAEAILARWRPGVGVGPATVSACRERSRMVRGVGRIGVRRAQVDELGWPGWRCVSELELGRPGGQIASRPAIGSPRGEGSGRTRLGHDGTCLVPGPGVWGPVVPRPVPARGVLLSPPAPVARAARRPASSVVACSGTRSSTGPRYARSSSLPQACTGWPATPGDPCPPGGLSARAPLQYAPQQVRTTPLRVDERHLPCGA